MRRNDGLYYDIVLFGIGISTTAMITTASLLDQQEYSIFWAMFGLILLIHTLFINPPIEKSPNIYSGI